ncbi:hypothetical protein EDC39_1237 [Geothermobacter ehrlichii]|uniref:Uncharacterized protein n=1 Tax=Geothermobacter ehrlichii TaxID=213224 RepID=A0A5D3WG79_9BACT|nr:hypothetical protein [Geothermobacter ehrlichii]TYO95044.1 hypothetical protein EDC39_1237 [Geothermobacter ehrlichii]
MKLRNVISACCLCILIWSGMAFAELQGVAEWRYVDFQRDSKTLDDLSVGSFSQQYTLLWKKQGLIHNGRGGQYDLSLGAEWTSFGTRLDQEGQASVDLDNETKKILYRGELLLAPGGLPFRFHAFSYDEHKSTFLEDTSPALQRSLLRPGIITDIANGQHITSGATLLVGIRNGSYMGRYRDVLSQLPRLLVDYRETYVRDVHGDTPQHFRERNLAFVSLNKKDNWFHYRYTDYTNFMQPDGSDDFVEKTYLLGTIDHQQIRRWINITNWIKISADGSYTTTDHVRGQDYPESRIYDFHLFSRMRRTNWGASEFTSYRREVEGNRLNKLLEVPFFASGELDRNTSWRFQFIGSRDREEYLDGTIFANSGQPLSDEDDAYLQTRIETFRQGRYIFSPMIEVEAKGGDEGDGYAARATFEFYSNSRYRPKYEIYGSYVLSRFDGNGLLDETVDAWEQEAVGRVETQVSRFVRLAMEQRLAYSDGTTDKNVTIHIQPLVNDGLVGTLTEVDRTGGATFRSTTKLRGEFTTTWRMDNTLELIYDYVDTGDKRDDQLILKHRLDYDNRKFSLRMKNNLIKGARPVSEVVTGSLIQPGGFGGGSLNFEHSSRLSYSPGRAWEVTGRVDYLWQDTDAGDTSDLSLRQTATYNFYHVNGLIRKIGLLKQELEYERFEAATGQTTDVTRYSLLAEYYPTRRTLLGGEVKYTVPETGSDLLTWNLVAAANFEKLQVRLEYAYGTDDDTDEQRWEVNVRKIF